MRSCGMNEIVAKKDEGAVFHFDRLYSLQIWNMHRLDRFYSGSHSLTCPSLRMLWVFNCPRLRLLGSQSTRNHGKNGDDKIPHLSPQQPLFMIEEVIPKLEDWTLNNKEAIMIMQDPHWKDRYLSKLKILRLSFFGDEVAATFLDSITQKAPNLKTLILEYGFLQEIFRDKRIAYKEGEIKINTQLESLTLTSLPLQHICREGCKIDPILEVLQFLYVTECADLKTLVASSVTFSHLSYLEIKKCNGLTNLIYSSTATSLVNLQGMTLRECNSLEEIVTQWMNETRDEIVFRSLRNIALESLPRLSSFSSSQCFFRFPLLEKVVVRQCPRMKTFCERTSSTPMLRKVITKEGKDEEWCWDGDLNRTIKKIHVGKVAFSSSTYLELSEYPELKELWYSNVGQKVFCNLRHLVVHKCTFLSNVIFLSNSLQLLNTLEELEVSECDSLEAIFGLKAMKSKEVSRLKKLILSKLPNLKHIWNREAREIINFGNLQIVKVDKCPNLKYVFSSSLCQDLRQLEELTIEYCGVEQIVANEEGLEELKFYFPLLRIFRLIYLTQLNDFYPKNYSLECPSLKTLNVYRCEALQIFAFCADLPMQQALFHMQKVSRNLEELSLNEKDALRMSNERPFERVEMLRLQYFHETPIKILNDLIQIFPATTILQVRSSSIETLFNSREIGHSTIESPTQIKSLELFQMEQLKHIWNDDDSASHPLVQNLENLNVVQCSGIMRLAPLFASFKSLQCLYVESCNELMHFMTSCTAKSLIRLTSLYVINCGMLEEVVMMDEGELEEEVRFESLKYLELTCLSSFKSFCSGKHTFIFPSLVTLKVMGCDKMQNFSSGVITAPFLKSVQVENGKECWKEDLNTTVKQLFIDKAIGEGIQDDNQESTSIAIQSSQTHQKSAGKSRALSTEEHGAESKAGEIVDLGKQQIHKLPIPHTGINTQKICEITEMPPDQASQNALSLTKVDAAIEIQEMLETTEGDIVQDAENTLSFTIVQDADIRTEEMNDAIQIPFAEANDSTLTHTSVQQTDGIRNHEINQTLEKVLAPIPQNVLGSYVVDNIAIGTHVMHERIDKPSVQAIQSAWDIAIIPKKEKSHDSDIYLSKNLFDQTTTSMATDYKENPPPSQASKATSSSTTPAANVSSAIGTKEIHDTRDKPLVQTNNQDTKKLATAQNIEESRDSYTEVHQDVANSAMIHEAAVDPSPSQAAEPKISSIQKSNICGNYKGMIDIPEQNMPYLEAGVKRHPQVLDWLNTKQRRVFASSFFSLFVEVTRILRTTRGVDLTEDDRNYIRECCTALQGVGFDESWISYVHGCIEECEDGEDLKRKVGEAEGQASHLKAQLESIKRELASVEESLVLLHDKTSRLRDFIES